MTNESRSGAKLTETVTSPRTAGPSVILPAAEIRRPPSRDRRRASRPTAGPPGAAGPPGYRSRRTRKSNPRHESPSASRAAASPSNQTTPTVTRRSAAIQYSSEESPTAGRRKSVRNAGRHAHRRRPRREVPLDRRRRPSRVPRGGVATTAEVRLVQRFFDAFVRHEGGLPGPAEAKPSAPAACRTGRAARAVPVVQARGIALTGSRRRADSRYEVRRDIPSRRNRSPPSNRSGSETSYCVPAARRDQHGPQPRQAPPPRPQQPGEDVQRAGGGHPANLAGPPPPANRLTPRRCPRRGRPSSPRPAWGARSPPPGRRVWNRPAWCRPTAAGRWCPHPAAA